MACAPLVSAWRTGYLLEHDLFREPDPTFRDHALERPLAAVVGESLGIVDAGALPAAGGWDVARGRTACHMGLEPARECDDRLERDAGRRAISRRGDLEPRQLGFILRKRRLLGLAIRRSRRVSGAN